MSFGTPGFRTSYPSGSEVYVWAGALTPTSFRVIADLVQTAHAARLVVSTNSNMSSPVFTSAYVEALISFGVAYSYKTVTLDATGLTSNTTYYYEIQCKDAPGSAGNAIRSIKTAPAAGTATPFRFAFGSCTAFSSDVPEPIFRAIALDNPLFYMHIGDMDYSDQASTDAGAQRDVMSRAYRAKSEVDILHRSVPIVYMWDDHDSGVNDNDLATNNQQTILVNGRKVIRETVPLYPSVQTGLGETNIDRNILSQVFDIGKCRFIVPDIRSQRRISAGTALGRNLGNGDCWDQLSWLSSAIAQAGTDGMLQIFLVITSTWTGGAYSGYGDVFTTEKALINTIINASTVPVALLVGDAHEGAFDDGTNSGGRPQIMSSPMAHSITLTGAGPFTWKGQTVTNRFQNNRSIYCVMDVAADNLSWTATMKGSPYDESTSAPTTLGSVSSTDLSLGE